MGSGLVKGSDGEKMHPIYFIDLLDFEKLQHVDTLDLREALVVFVSHLWQKHPEESHSRPDTRDNAAFRLCKEGVRRLYEEHAALLPRCMLWLDYSCVNHPEWVDSAQHRRRLNSKAAAGKTAAGEDSGLALTYAHLQLDEILRRCDCLFSPVLQAECWRALGLSLGHAPASRVPGWNNSSTCYMNRAWCRLEMFLGAALPLSEESAAKSKWFGGTLAAAASAQRRPHFLFGPALDLLQCLPPLQSSLLLPLHPLRGALSNPTDLPLVRLLCARLPSLLARQAAGSRSHRWSWAPLARSLSSAGDPLPTTLSGWRNWRGQVSDSQGEVHFGSGDEYRGGVRAGVLHGCGVYTHIEGDVYRGEFRNNEMSGAGVYTYKDGEQYAGEWLRGLKHGTGSFTFACGDVYRGQWRRDVMHGEGCYKYSSGDQYCGTREEGVVTGRGVLTCANGDKYSGEFLRGQRHGQGEFLYADGSRYCGRWVHGVVHGFGRFWSRDGWAYQGMWANEVPEGEGLLTYKSGDVYRGVLQGGRRHGAGVLTCSNGDVYTGHFERDQFSGAGEQVLASGETFVGTFRAGQRLRGVCTKRDGVYEGEWQDGKRGGHGVFRYQSGSRYEGGWLAGYKHGAGTFAHHRGDFFRGHFARNKFHGYGVLTSRGGDVYRGSWQEGRRHGRGQQHYQSGDHFCGEWRANRRARGRMRFWSGEIFEGDYDERGRQRAGQFTYLSGGRYDGAFAGRERNGRGKYSSVSESPGERVTITVTTADWMHDFAIRTIDVSSASAAPPAVLSSARRLTAVVLPLDDCDEENEDEDEEDEDEDEDE